MTQPEQEAREMLKQSVLLHGQLDADAAIDAMLAFAARPTAGIDREEPNVETAQAGIESAAESDGTDQAAGTEEGPQGSSQTIEARKLAERLTVDADGIVKAWDQRYAPEGVGAGIMRPVEVDTMREAAAFLRGLPTAAKTGERGAAIEECARIADERAAGREQLFEENGASINAAKAVEAEEIAKAIRALSQPLPDAPIVGGDIATLSLQYGEDGNLRIWSDQFPGLVLSHKGHDLVMADVLPALKTMGWPAPPVLPIDGE